MLERDMEDLISEFPDDFFPRHSLTLRARQKSFKGVGRFDLHFVDQFGTNLLMELKAVPARYEDASQLAKYRDAMIASGENRVLMWLVAPAIPMAVRDFLTHVGIEYTEIHESEFRRVAALRQVSAQLQSSKELSPKETTPSATRQVTGLAPSSSSDKAWHFNTDEGEIAGATDRMLEHSCFALWGYPNSEQRMNRPREAELILFYKSKFGVIGAGFIGPGPAQSSNMIFGKQAEQEFMRQVVNLVSVPAKLAVSYGELCSLGLKGPVMGALSRRYPASIADAVRSALLVRTEASGPNRKVLHSHQPDNA